MKIDLSSVKHVRDIACKDPSIASLLLGMSPELADLYGAANGYCKP